MPCALLLLLLSLGHDLAAKKEENRMRDENKKSVLLKPREIVLSTPDKKKLWAPATRATVLGSSSNLDHMFLTGFLYRRSFRILAKSARTKR